MALKYKDKPITLKGVATTLASISTVLVIFFGVSLAGTFKNVKEVLNSPPKIDQLIINDSVIMSHIEQSEHSTEMMWELFRLMTDDNDSLEWFYVDDQGISFNVDIRNTAEFVELAFVFEGHKIYPVFSSTADDRKYIIRKNGGEDYNTYLFKR